jgi:hypothetical protein
MSRTGEPHRGLGRLFVRKRTRWPHLWARTPWSGNSRLFKPEPTTPQNKHGAPVAFDGAHAARRRRGRHRHRPRRPRRFHRAPGRAPSWCRCRCPGSPERRRARHGCSISGQKGQDVSAAAEKRARWNCRWHPTKAGSVEHCCALLRTALARAGRAGAHCNPVQSLFPFFLFPLLQTLPLLPFPVDLPLRLWPVHGGPSKPPSDAHRRSRGLTASWSSESAPHTD